jgi:hypothetical protein
LSATAAAVERSNIVVVNAADATGLRMGQTLVGKEEVGEHTQLEFTGQFRTTDCGMQPAVG